MNARTAGDAERVYRFIRAFIGDNGYPPRRLDIIEGLDLTVYHLDRALIRLQSTGRLERHSYWPTDDQPPPPAA